MYFRPKSEWGSYLWGFIHTVTIIDSEWNEKYVKETVEILKGIEHIIPCQKCKMEYNEALSLIDVKDTKSMVLFYWSVDLHNKVNKKLNKKEWTYEMALDKWCKRFE